MPTTWRKYMNFYQFQILKTSYFLDLISTKFKTVEHIDEILTFRCEQKLSEVEQFIYALYLINEHYRNQGADLFATNEDTRLFVMGCGRQPDMILLAPVQNNASYEYEKLKNVDHIYPIGYITCQNTASEIGILKYIELQLPSITRITDSDADYATSLRLFLDENFNIESSDNSDNVDCFVDKYKYLLDGICDFLKDKPLDVHYSFYPPSTRIENVATWLSDNN